MSLPKRLATGVRYLGSSAFNCYVDFVDPNQGQTNGTPNPPQTVMCHVPANISPWRSKEVDKQQTRIGQSAFKIVIHYPQTFSVNSGMQVLHRGQTHEIESVYDPDGQRRELHIWTWTSNPVEGPSCQ